MTASEPLSLEEEYEMQASWRDDPAKCTFILLDATGTTQNPSELDSSCLHHMAGDTNLFFNDSEDSTCAEIEIMIAEKSSRRKGLAYESIELLSAYAVQFLKVEKLVAKIGVDNVASLSLFKKLGFKEVAFCETFKEFTLQTDKTAIQRYQTVQLNIMEDCDVETNPYERPEGVDQYLALHYGQTPGLVDLTIRPHSNRPNHALEFPKRCATFVKRIADLVSCPTGKGTRVLDLGCGVGGASFELTTMFENVLGCDNSTSFISMAKTIRDSFHPKSFLVDPEASPLTIELDKKVVRARVEFVVGDACDLSQLPDNRFDAVLMANLLCRLPKPMSCLKGLCRILKPGGVIAMISPFSWLKCFTEEEFWLKEEQVIEFMKSEGFTLVLQEDMPLIIREHERKYQYIVSAAMGFTKSQPT